MIYPNVFYGEVYKDSVEIQFSGKKNEEQNLKMTASFMAINGASTEFTSFYDGFIGLAPYTTKSSDLQSLSLLKQVMDAKIIEKPMISFYVSKNYKVQSSIKFGSYDRQAILDEGEIPWTKSINAAFPALRLYKVVAGSDLMKQTTQDRYLEFEP